MFIRRLSSLLILLFLGVFMGKEMTYSYFQGRSNLALVGYFRAENNADDATSYKNNGQIYGAKFTQGIAGSAFNLDGEEGYLQIPENKLLNLQSEFTIATWIKSNETRLNGETKQREILTRRGSNISFGYEYEEVEYKTWLRFYVRFEDGRSQEVEKKEINGKSTRDSNWHHLAVTFKKGDKFNLYIDGKLIDSEVAPPKNIKLSSSNNDYIIGARMKNDGQVDRNLQADLDEIMILNKSLEKEEIQKLFQLKGVL